MGGRRIALTAVLMASAALIAVPAAQASFHLIKVREVYAGSNDDSYVELQMYAGGQNFLGGHSLTLYDASGTLLHTSTFSASVANGANQSTVLIGDSNVAATFGVAPDLVDAGLAVPAAGGAACWNAGGIPADCVAWGDFSGGAALQTATGTTVGTPVSPLGITAGKAIRRTIAPGCPTLLEEADDSNDSATDFSEVTPAPRDNATVPTETTCPGVPETAIDTRPPLHSNSPDAAFTYDAPTATSYECRLDGTAFAPCPLGGPQEYTGLLDGSHTFQVRGVNVSGPDPTPAGYTWAVDTVAPTVTIDSHPADPSPGASAAFTFHADESASFECSLAPVGEPDAYSACSSSKTYTSLSDGEWAFRVRATDLAGNLGAAESFSWTVDNAVTDTTPPQTTIDSRPPDPDPSSTASFTYESNEPGSSFECALDGATFSPCPTAGISYSGLGDGPHSFQVRAIDPSANVDPTPAGDSFDVEVAEPPAPAPTPPVSPPPLGVPQTTISFGPPARTRDRTPTFRFSASPPGASFQCSVDGGSLRPCRSPFTTAPLRPGRHAVSIRAVLAGIPDPTPARLVFRVLRRARR